MNNNASLFNISSISINYSFSVDPQFMDFIIISLIILGLGIVLTGLISFLKEYSNDKLIKNSLICKNILFGLIILFTIYLLVCLFFILTLSNNYFQIFTLLLPVIITITYEYYQRKNEEILFKKVLERYTGILKKALKCLESDNTKVDKIQKYLNKNNRDFQYILDQDNGGIMNDRISSVSNSYFYLLDLINRGVPSDNFRILSSNNSIPSLEEKNTFIDTYNFVLSLKNNQEGVNDFFDRYMDILIKNKGIFQAYENTTFPLGISVKEDYEKIIECLKSIIDENEKYLRQY